MENRERKSGQPTGWILALSFAVSAVTLVVYITDTVLADETLFLLLTVLLYSSILVCVCSVYKLLLIIYRFIRHHEFRLFKMILYPALILYAVSIFFFKAFITVISGGNG